MYTISEEVDTLSEDFDTLFEYSLFALLNLFCVWTFYTHFIILSCWCSVETTFACLHFIREGARFNPLSIDFYLSIFLFYNVLLLTNFHLFNYSSCTNFPSTLRWFWGF